MMAETRIEVLDPPSNKDPRSFRPNSLDEINVVNNYRPLAFHYTKSDGSPGQCQLGCGNSGRDLLLIAACYAGLYSLALGFFALLLRGALATDGPDQTLLWAFFVVGVIFASLVGGAVHVGMMGADRERKERKRAAERAKEAVDVKH